MSGVIDSSCKTKVRRPAPPERMSDFAESWCFRQRENGTHASGVNGTHASGVLTRIRSGTPEGAYRLLTEFLVRQENLCVRRLKKDQPHFFQLPVSRQELLACARRDFGGLRARVAVKPGRERRQLHGL